MLCLLSLLYFTRLLSDRNQFLYEIPHLLNFSMHLKLLSLYVFYSSIFDKIEGNGLSAFSTI